MTDFHEQWRINHQVPIKVFYRDNGTGEVVSEDAWCNKNDDGSPSPFWYEDGNASCDCNRRAFFWKCKGVDIHGDEPVDGWPDGATPCPCGNGDFSVNLAMPDGSVFYREFETPNRSRRHER